MAEGTTTIARSEGVLSRVLDGEAVLLDTEGGAYFGLNAVGTRVWELIGSGGTTEDALLTTLLTEFDVTRDVLAKDLRDLLAGLEQRHLIQVNR
ncbi:MAG: PqqD family protein [Polyangiaceae bacterium]